MKPGDAARQPWFERQHTLSFGKPLGDGSRRLRWRGPGLVGIVNVTPDSFSDGGRLVALDKAVEAGLSMVAEGALAVDVGGESTRPGAEPVDEAEETRRVVPVIEALAAEGVLLSIDTRKPSVARAALAAGARMVNDVGGLRHPEMVTVCVEAGAPVIAMHMLGEPATMQDDPTYDDVVADVLTYLSAAADAARASGVLDVIIDPGIGFGKTTAHNLALLAATDRFVATGRPVLVGASRKGLIHTLADAPRPSERLGGSIAIHLAAARGGAALLRVHDVAQHRQALRVEAAMAGDVTYSRSR